MLPEVWKEKRTDAVATSNTRRSGVCIENRAKMFGELSSLLTVKTLTGMTTDVYPRENCIAPDIVLIV